VNINSIEGFYSTERDRHSRAGELIAAASYAEQQVALTGHHSFLYDWGMFYVQISEVLRFLFCFCSFFVFFLFFFSFFFFCDWFFHRISFHFQVIPHLWDEAIRLLNRGQQMTFAAYTAQRKLEGGGGGGGGGNSERVSTTEENQCRLIREWTAADVGDAWDHVTVLQRSDAATDAMYVAILCLAFIYFFVLLLLLLRLFLFIALLCFCFHPFSLRRYSDGVGAYHQHGASSLIISLRDVEVHGSGVVLQRSPCRLYLGI
jgi:hypothetical protein